jgi:GTPase SAR1 family protein
VPGSVEFTEAVKSPKLIGFVNRWHEDQLSVLILGASGTGKSASVAALMRRMYGGLECRPPADDDESVAMAAKRYDWGILRSLLWTNGFEIANAKRYSPLGSEPAIIEKCKKASLLVVDEVGQESYDGTLFEIIEARYCNQAPTIVTSGLHREEFLAKYGSGMYRRLTEKPYATAINLWPSSKSLEVVK